MRLLVPRSRMIVTRRGRSTCGCDVSSSWSAGCAAGARRGALGGHGAAFPLRIGFTYHAARQMSSDIRQFAGQVIEAEVNALRGLVPALDEHFDRAVRLILDCPGTVLTSGIGKAGHVARKLSASF